VLVEFFIVTHALGLHDILIQRDLAVSLSLLFFFDFEGELLLDENRLHLSVCEFVVGALQDLLHLDFYVVKVAVAETVVHSAVEGDDLVLVEEQLVQGDSDVTDLVLLGGAPLHLQPLIPHQQHRLLLRIDGGLEDDLGWEGLMVIVVSDEDLLLPFQGGKSEMSHLAMIFHTHPQGVVHSHEVLGVYGKEGGPSEFWDSDTKGELMEPRRDELVLNLCHHNFLLNHDVLSDLDASPISTLIDVTFLALEPHLYHLCGVRVLLDVHMDHS